MPARNSNRHVGRQQQQPQDEEYWEMADDYSVHSGMTGEGYLEHSKKRRWTATPLQHPPRTRHEQTQCRDWDYDEYQRRGSRDPPSSRNSNSNRQMPIVMEDSEYEVPGKSKNGTNYTYKKKRQEQPEVDTYYPMEEQADAANSTPSTPHNYPTKQQEKSRTAQPANETSSSSEGLSSNGSYTLDSLETGTSESFTEGGSYLNGSSYTTGTTSLDDDTIEEARSKCTRQHRDRMPILSQSETTVTSLETSLTDNAAGDEGMFAFIASDLSGVLMTKQDVAYCSLSYLALQLLLLMLQLTMCGIAPFETNMMIGPYPDAFSEWGGKNPYLLVAKNEWWRLLTPALLNVGIVHLMVNAACILSACALFEREWGASVWLFFLFLGTVGCTAFSHYFDPDTIAVGSSGSMLGLYGAKIAELTLQVFGATGKKDDDREIMSLQHFWVILGGIITLFFLGCFTYIDLSGNLGGLFCGLSAGTFYFSYELRSCCRRFLVILIGLTSLFVPTAVVFYYFLEEAELDEQLGDVCQYFRFLFTENYECGCMWK